MSSAFTSPLLDRLRMLRNAPSAAPVAPQRAVTQQASPAPSLPPTPRPVPPPDVTPPKPKPSTPPRPVLNRPPAVKAAPAVKVAEAVTPSANLPAPSPKVLDLLGLPAELGRLVGMAQAGKLPSGPQQLASGLVLDLGGYVLAWAECWPRDSVHVQRRLTEAYEVVEDDG